MRGWAWVLGPALERYAAGEREGAVDSFLFWAIGPDYRTWLDTMIPCAYNQMVADADTFFDVELPSMQEWFLTREDARRITQPVLGVFGSKSSSIWPGWSEVRELCEWVPQTELFVVVGANHALEEKNRRGVAEAMVPAPCPRPGPNPGLTSRSNRRPASQATRIWRVDLRWEFPPRPGGLPERARRQVRPSKPPPGSFNSVDRAWKIPDSPRERYLIPGALRSRLRPHTTVYPNARRAHAMLRFTFGYVRYALSALAIVGFGGGMN